VEVKKRNILYRPNWLIEISPSIMHRDTFLTLWHQGGFGDFRKKNSSFRLPYQRPSSSADCARQLFNGSNGSASLVTCTR